jgi:hypothetical protein
MDGSLSAAPSTDEEFRNAADIEGRCQINCAKANETAVEHASVSNENSTELGGTIPAKTAPASETLQKTGTTMENAKTILLMIGCTKGLAKVAFEAVPKGFILFSFKHCNQFIQNKYYSYQAFNTVHFNY